MTQLQPTTQTYPLPINIQSLTDETDTGFICQELCTLIYCQTLPHTDIPRVNNFADLKREILTVKRQLQKRHLALILYECNPTDELVKVCRKLTDIVYIAWITSEPIQPPLRGFLPNQPNLETAIQSWLEEIG